MLKKIKKQENMLMIFFVGVLLLIGTYIMLEKNVVDIVYFLMMLFLFARFLMIRKNGR